MVLKNMTKYFIRNGFVEKLSTLDNVTKTTSFDLTRWLKKLLTYLNVQFYDKCCDSNSDYRPVRYNTNTNLVEYFDGTDWTEID